MASNVLFDRDVNTSLSGERSECLKPRSMEYHRQVFQSRMEDESDKNTYVSPSDDIMSPCTAKLSAMKNRHVMKAKPKSLFAAQKVSGLPTSKEQLASESSLEQSASDPKTRPQAKD